MVDSNAHFIVIAQVNDTLRTLKCILINQIIHINTTKSLSSL